MYKQKSRLLHRHTAALRGMEAAFRWICYASNRGVEKLVVRLGRRVRSAGEYVAKAQLSPYAYTVILNSNKRAQMRSGLHHAKCCTITEIQPVPSRASQLHRNVTGRGTKGRV